MVPDIKKILYATDLSENARVAFGYAGTIANRFGAGVNILHVLEDVSAYQDSLVISIIGKDRWNRLREENEQKVVDMIKNRIEEFCQEISSKMPACPFITEKVIVKIGNPVEEILKTADELDADMIVMGARGRGIIEDALIGSVSRRVLRRSKRPVLVVKYDDKA